MKKVFPFLSYAGAIPFILCPIYLYFNLKPLIGLSFSWLFTAKTLSTYSLIIICFLAGSHWGQHLNIGQPESTYLAISSNIIVVCLWLSALVFSLKPLFFIFVAGLTILLLIDYLLLQRKRISSHYFKTRFQVTTIAIISLITTSFIV